MKSLLGNNVDVNVVDNEGCWFFYFIVIDNIDILDMIVLECLLEYDVDFLLIDVIERIFFFYYIVFDGDDIFK